MITLYDSYYAVQFGLCCIIIATSYPHIARTSLFTDLETAIKRRHVTALFQFMLKRFIHIVLRPTFTTVELQC